MFCRFYDIKRQFAEPLVMQAAEQYDPVLYFLENTNLALDCISVEDVFLHCKHITTSKDDLASFSQYGLLSLKGSLSKDTSLRRFLLENEIEIDMEQMTFSFKGKTIYLHDYSSDCIACHYGECKHRRLLWNGEIDIAYKNTWCNFREKTRPLSLKLYHDKAEIEVHLSGDNHDVHDYSCVKRCPEILLTINTLVKEIYKQDVSLPQKWALQQSRRYYCLSFDVNIRDFEFITTDAMYDRSYYMPYLDFCRTQYDTLPERNINFYGNVFLLSKSIAILTDNISSTYGAILPSVEIPFNTILIEKFEI